tara:strand:+ start:8207 stop:8935 length:729 start_codon:yes stop_codon:yes gene_type:complete
MSGLFEKIALVTGAERGIGKSIAKRLAAEGAEVYVNYLEDHQSAQQVVSEIEAAGGVAQALQADISEEREIRNLFDNIERLDFLVNNAGTGSIGPLESITAEDIDRVFCVNVRGTALCARAALARMGRGGRIVNISSSTTRYPLAGMSVYTASKAAIKAFTEVWAKELGHLGINVNSVLPGPTVPGMTEQASEEVRSAMAAASPYARLGDADEIADVVCFLCSPQSRWISGQHICVNGAASA